jgi:hypothetical protein
MPDLVAVVNGPFCPFKQLLAATRQCSTSTKGTDKNLAKRSLGGIEVA